MASASTPSAVDLVWHSQTLHLTHNLVKVSYARLLWTLQRPNFSNVKTNKKSTFLRRNALYWYTYKLCCDRFINQRVLPHSLIMKRKKHKAVGRNLIFSLGMQPDKYDVLYWKVLV